MNNTLPTARSSLTLPAIEVSESVRGLGRVVHVLHPALEASVESVTDSPVSARITEPLYTLSSGERVLVTSRPGRKPPEDIDGVLLVRTSHPPKWLWHRAVHGVQDRIANEGWEAVSKASAEQWRGAFRFEPPPGSGGAGLRPAQLGALHAIGAHWSLFRQPGTVVMPTGTGKTETMIAATLAFGSGTTLVVVPSKVLRDQVARKFSNLGLLRSLGLVENEIPNPVVGVLTQRPRTAKDLEMLRKCNVVVGTVQSLAQGTASQLAGEIAELSDILVVDEAHHVAARTWADFREAFVGHKVLQFTATPYRLDGQIVDGKVLYNYPLSKAQSDGYFKQIDFAPVFAIDRNDADGAIAAAAVEQLRSDLKAGFDHLLMARCNSIERAEDVVGLYNELAPEFKPLLVHSEVPDAGDQVAALQAGTSRIAVCVDMLGEGFDLPQLKIAAVHDAHKSLAVLLQFTGRFTRTAPQNIGNATVVANIADQDVSSALERLYSEDADWNKLLSEFSSQAVKQHMALLEFLGESEQVTAEDDADTLDISQYLLRPKHSVAVYRADHFTPKAFFKGLPKNVIVHRVWLHARSQTLYFVTRQDPRVPWTRSRELSDRQWDLFVLHFNASQQLLYVHSSDKSSLHDRLARAVGGTGLISGEVVFRTLGNVSRLRLQNVGVKKLGRRNLRFAMYSGADVAHALSESEKAGAVKSNLFGTGWENGQPTSVGCSYKGRVWSREQGTVPELTTWCAKVGAKITDEAIDPAKLIENVLVPTEVTQVPDVAVLGVDWPHEILSQPEERTLLKWEGQETPLGAVDLQYDSKTDRSVCFRIAGNDYQATFEHSLSLTNGYEIKQLSGPPTSIRVGRLEMPLEEYLGNYPILVRFVDLSELDGHLLVRLKTSQLHSFPAAQMEAWDWSSVDITKESLWKASHLRWNSIQGHVAGRYLDSGFEFVFDDDGPGEAADLVCLKEEEDHIRLVLVHCKFSSGEAPGVRVSDVQEVSAQAVRSSKWAWRFKDLLRHLIVREKQARTSGRTRALKGNVKRLNHFAQASRFKEIRAEILVAQPGVSYARLSKDQSTVLGAADGFLKETVGVPLEVVCSQ